MKATYDVMTGNVLYMGREYTPTEFAEIITKFYPTGWQICDSQFNVYEVKREEFLRLIGVMSQ